MSSRLKLFIDIALMIPLAMSCSVIEQPTYENYENTVMENEFEQIKVNSANLPLFANLASFNIVPKTKSAIEPCGELTSLESLLDRDKTEVIHLREHQIMTAIPFKNGLDSNPVTLMQERTDAIPRDSLTVSRLFVISIEDTEEGSVFYFISTLIPDSHCRENFDISQLIYSNLADFSGMEICSRLDGTFLSADYFPWGGPADAMTPVSPEEIPDSSSTYYLSVVHNNMQTKTTNKLEIKGGELEAAFCFASKGEELQPAFCTASKPGGSALLTDRGAVNLNGSGQTPQTTANTYGGGGGGGAQVNSNNQNNRLYQVQLSASNGGTVQGNGRYRALTKVNICASRASGYVFDRWTGDFEGCPPTFTFYVDRNISSTAYFRNTLTANNKIRPCYNSYTGGGNPLIDMVLAPTASGNVNNAVYSTSFGTGTPNTRKHNGIDFYATEGTPVYAMYDGVIDYPYVTEQPNRIAENTYPSTYNGKDKDAAGNRIYIKTKINGAIYNIGYWHLQAGNAAAYNYREGRVFKPGDKVYRGEIIGYTGRTGNAWDVPNKHCILL